MTGILAALLSNSAVTVTLMDRTASKGAIHPATATATAAINSTGAATFTSASGYTWLNGGLASSYEIRATTLSNSGLTSVGSDAFGSFLALSSSRSWAFKRSSVGDAAADVLLEIRPVSGSVIASCTVTFDCSVS